MQRQFTIECRVDYADNTKNDLMKAAVAAAARHVNATAILLADGVKPQTVTYSDDFFSGHEKIELLPDTIRQGVNELSAAGLSDEEPVSQELMDAMKK